MTNAQIQKMVETRNDQMALESIARGEYFAATQKRAASIGKGEATSSGYNSMMALKSNWENIRAR